MIWYILAFIFTIIFSAAIEYDSLIHFFGLSIVVGVFVSVMLIITAPIYGVYDPLPQKIEKYKVISLTSSINAQGDISGAFMLVHGTIEGESSEDIYYHMYLKDRDGIRAFKIKATDVLVVEQEVKEAELIIKRADIELTWLGLRISSLPDTNTLVVPKGTLAEYKYNIDLNN